MNSLLKTLFIVLSLTSVSWASDLPEVLKHNDALFNAFLKEDQKAVESTSKVLIESLSKSKSKELESLRSKVSELKKISAKNKKEDNLTTYSNFVPTLVEVVKKYNKDSNYGIFYCPMIQKYWVQDVRVNPGVKNVFAQEMLECGEKTKS